ncbi:MAG TPA: autotransporter outer membrane beta-barrel domain-containing protein [Pseudolabrys sp.]|nr:autotransporter outer membrane beta-barrel domain-containing protein [Pseudolabrys sp.]
MRPSGATLLLVRNLLASVSAVALIAAQTQAAYAHTVSIGYAFSGPGAVTFWYGSYHPTATFNEADLQLVGPAYNQTQNFNLITAIKPMGLIDGTNNFYSNTAGTALVGVPEAVVSTDGSGGAFDPATQSIQHWQGVIFSGLRPGTYTFTYNPLALPTVEWHPINSIVETNTFTLTAQDILGIPGYRFYGTNVNQRAVGRGLDTAINAGGYNQRIYNIAALPPAQMANALTQLSGEVHTQSSRAAFQSGGTFLSAMMDPFSGGGDFGAAPFGGGYYSGSGGGGSPYGAPPSGGGYYDPQAPGGYGGANGNGGQQYDPATGIPYDPNGQNTGNGGYGNQPSGGSAGYGNSTDGRSGNDGNGRDGGGGLFQRREFENHWGVWQTTYGSYNTAQGDAVIGSHDTTITNGGVIAGLDFRYAPGGVIGAAISGGVTSWSLSENLGKGKGDITQAGLYGSQRFGQAYISGALSAGWQQMKTERDVSVGGNDTLRGSFTAHTFGGRAELGYRIALADIGLTPHIAGQMMTFDSPAYGETVGAGANDYALDIAKRRTTQTRTEAGLWLDRAVPLDDALLSMRGRVAWVNERADAPSVEASFQTLPGSNFTVIGATPAPNRLLLSAGSELRFVSGWSVSTKFDGEFARGTQNYLAMATIRYQW